MTTFRQLLKTLWNLTLEKGPRDTKLRSNGSLKLPPSLRILPQLDIWIPTYVSVLRRFLLICCLQKNLVFPVFTHARTKILPSKKHSIHKGSLCYQTRPVLFSLPKKSGHPTSSVQLPKLMCAAHRSCQTGSGALRQFNSINSTTSLHVTCAFCF